MSQDIKNSNVLNGASDVKSAGPSMPKVDEHPIDMGGLRNNGGNLGGISARQEDVASSNGASGTGMVNQNIASGKPGVTEGKGQLPKSDDVLMNQQGEGGMPRVGGESLVGGQGKLSGVGDNQLASGRSLTSKSPQPVVEPMLGNNSLQQGSRTELEHKAKEVLHELESIQQKMPQGDSLPPKPKKEFSSGAVKAMVGALVLVIALGGLVVGGGIIKIPGIGDIRRAAEGNCTPDDPTCCDGWAESGKTHCNTSQCLEYVCNNGEWEPTNNTCGDLNVCNGTAEPDCGDGICNGGEDCSTCFQDCNGGGTCEANAGAVQCTDGGQPDQNKWLICECNDEIGCGPAGTCDRNCRLVDIGTRPDGPCYQIDYVMDGTSNYCQVEEVVCQEVCVDQSPSPTPTVTPTTPPNPTATPTLTSTPTPTTPPNPTATPTLTSTPTPKLSDAPTPTPTTVSAPSASPTPVTLPQSGSTGPTLMLMTGGAMLLLIGAAGMLVF